MNQRLNKAKSMAKNAANATGRGVGKAVRAAGEAIGNGAKAVGDAAKVAGEVLTAAMLGNKAEKTLSLTAHDVIRDAQLAGEEARTQSGDRRGSSPREDCSIPDADIIRLFKATATAVWKLKGRMINIETGEPKDDFRKVWRHVETIGDALTEIGVETIDWTGRPYDDGMSLKVIAWEKDASLKRATITETLLPTIRFKRGDGVYQIQQGEVVVSDPAGEAQGEA